MQLHEKADHMTSISARRVRRRHPVRLLRSSASRGWPRCSSRRGECGESRRFRADEGLLCKSDPLRTDANPNSSFVLTAHSGHILTPDSNSVYSGAIRSATSPSSIRHDALRERRRHRHDHLKNKLNVTTRSSSPHDRRARRWCARFGRSTRQPYQDGGPQLHGDYSFTADHAGTISMRVGRTRSCRGRWSGRRVDRAPAASTGGPPHVQRHEREPRPRDELQAGKEFINLFSELDPDLHQQSSSPRPGNVQL